MSPVFRHVLVATSVTAALALASAAPLDNCTRYTFDNLIDHFRGTTPNPPNNLTYAQQFYICSQDTFNPETGCIFFYTGNEGPVELYVNNTGLMWENAASFNALLVFAEHRYYGNSLPSPDFSQMEFLSSAQALADYAVLLEHIKLDILGLTPEAAQSLVVVSYGGSYGGVLSGFMRAKYPGSIDMALAASAPYRAFPGQKGGSTWNSSSYYQVITRDASAVGGSTDACSANIRNLWPVLFADGQTASGLKRLSSSFQTCSPLETADDALALAFYIRGSWDSMSMGNFPFPSSYITGGAVTLPAFPVRVACSFLDTPIDPVANITGLYAAVNLAISVINNATYVPCNDISPNPYSNPATQIDGIWDYQRCVELQPDSFWFSTYGGTGPGVGNGDMFWPQLENISFTNTHCNQAWNVTPPLNWMSTVFDLPFFSGSSRILFSWGEYDPWGAASIQVSPDVDRDLVSVFVPQAAHHLDLFFSTPGDPQGLTEARLFEMETIRAWVGVARKERLARIEMGKKMRRGIEEL